MNTKDLVESLNEIAVNDLSEGANIVDHPAHMAAIELIGLDVMRADVRRLTDENAKLKREVDMAEKQSLDFYVEKENAALTSNRAMLNAEATRLTNTIIERNKKIDLRGDNIAKLLVERDTLEAEVKFLVEEAKCTESEFEKMEDEYAVIIRELREQLRWSPSEDQIMAAITSSNCGLKRVKWKDGIDINLPSGEALSFVAAILEFRPKQDKGSDK